MNQRQILEAAANRLSAAGIADAANDAWILMSEAFNMSRTDYYMHCDEEIDVSKSSAVESYNKMVDRRCCREPLQYILGKAYFMGYEFMVTADVLIPRFDTEILVSEALKYIESGARVLDMCTGSGCIAISIALQCKKSGETGHIASYDAVTKSDDYGTAQPSAAESNVAEIKVDAADISDAALTVAKRNAVRLGAGFVNFLASDMYENIDEEYDVIVSNPPYIPTADIDGLEPEVRICEPIKALDGAADGLFFYKILAEESGKHLSYGGYLLMEIGYNQAEAVSLLLEKNNYADIRVVKDLAGHDRVVCGRRI